MGVFPTVSYSQLLFFALGVTDNSLSVLFFSMTGEGRNQIPLHIGMKHRQHCENLQGLASRMLAEIYYGHGDRTGQLLEHGSRPDHSSKAAAGDMRDVGSARSLAQA